MPVNRSGNLVLDTLCTGGPSAVTDLCQPTVGYSFSLVDSLFVNDDDRENSLQRASTLIWRRAKEVLREVEAKTGWGVAEFRAGSSYIFKSRKARQIDVVDPATWSRSVQKVKGFVSCWHSYQSSGYHGLVVLAALKRPGDAQALERRVAGLAQADPHYGSRNANQALAFAGRLADDVPLYSLYVAFKLSERTEVARVESVAEHVQAVLPYLVNFPLCRTFEAAVDRLATGLTRLVEEVEKREAVVLKLLVGSMCVRHGAGAEGNQPMFPDTWNRVSFEKCQGLYVDDGGGGGEAIEDSYDRLVVLGMVDRNLPQLHKNFLVRSGGVHAYALAVAQTALYQVAYSSRYGYKVANRNLKVEEVLPQKVDRNSPFAVFVALKFRPAVCTPNRSVVRNNRYISFV